MFLKFTCTVIDAQIEGLGAKQDGVITPIFINPERVESFFGISDDNDDIPDGARISMMSGEAVSVKEGIDVVRRMIEGSL